MTQRTNIDTSTGEIVADAPEIQSQMTALALYSRKYELDSGLPIHLAMLARRTDMSPAKRMSMLLSYTGATPVGLDKFINKGVRILGGVVHWHGPYKSRPDANGDSTDMPGFYHCLLKVDQFESEDVLVDRKARTIKNHKIIATSANQVCDFFLGYMTTDRWYDFEYPIDVVFTGDRNAYFVRMLDPDDEQDDEPEAARGAKQPKVKVEEVTA